MSGDYFASFIRKYFDNLFETNGEKRSVKKIFLLMDNCPCQTSDSKKSFAIY